MNTTLIRSILIAAAMLFASTIHMHAADASAEAAAMSKKLIKAIENSDYEAFIADGEPAFKQMRKDQFEAVAALLGPKLRAGREISYLGELNQKGYRVTLWRVTYKDGSDDALVTLSMKDGRVGGFLMR